jgi:hypothetical protein
VAWFLASSRHAVDIAQFRDFTQRRMAAFFTDCLVGQTFDQLLQESSMARGISFLKFLTFNNWINSSSRNVGKKPAISTLHKIPKESRSQKFGSCVEAYLRVNTRRGSNIDCSGTEMLVSDLIFMLRTKYLDWQNWYCFCTFSSDH